MADLQSELRKAAAQAPGLERRSAYMKLDDEFDRTLKRRLTRLRHPDAEAFTHSLIRGCGSFAPDSFGEATRQLRLVPAPVVNEAARWLRQIRPEVFKHDWLEEMYRDLQRAYLGAAEHGEAVVIG
jgi:hypothetical protein